MYAQEDSEKYLKLMISGAFMAGVITEDQSKELVRTSIAVISGINMDDYETVKIEEVVNVFKLSDRSEAIRLWKKHGKTPLKFGTTRSSAIRFYKKDMIEILKKMQNNYLTQSQDKKNDV